MTTTDTDPEFVSPPTAEELTLRRPDVPVTVDQIAALGEAGATIIAARERIISTARRAAIRMCSPSDVILYRSDDGLVTGYLQDCGGDRVRDILGIEIFDVSRPEKVQGAEPHIFHYLITGSGRCRLTLQTLENVEGGRSSTDDFAKGKSGVELELLVRKAARANLDGNITRELAGLKSIPVEELAAAWQGTPKTVEQCRLGRGFGTRDERVGGRSEKAPDVEPPVCPHCGTKGAYRPAKGNRAAFYGCPQFKSHEDKRWIVDAARWEKEQQRKTAVANGAQTANGAASEPTTHALGRDAHQAAGEHAQKLAEDKAPELTDKDMRWS